MMLHGHTFVIDSMGPQLRNYQPRASAAGGLALTLDRLEHRFEHRVVVSIHPELCVHRLRPGVLPLHIQSKPHRPRRLRFVARVFVQPAVPAFAPMIGVDVDGLDPPDVGIAPIAPFESDHELRDHPVVFHPNVVVPLARVGENGPHTGLNSVRIEVYILGFFGHGDVSKDDSVGVFELGESNHKRSVAKRNTGRQPNAE